MAEYLFNEPRYNDPEAAREYLESVRWPKGPVCPHCGAVDRISKLDGKSHRPGLYDCGHCRDQFTVTVGTVFERSKIGLDKWLLAASLIGRQQEGHQQQADRAHAQRNYKTAWFMTHRLREAMKQTGGVFGSGIEPIEADATYVGGKEANKHRSKRNSNNVGGMGKQCVFTLVERNGGARSFHVLNVSADNLKPIITKQLNAERHA